MDTQAVALLSPEDTGHGNGNGHDIPPAAEAPAEAKAEDGWFLARSGRSIKR